MRTVEIVGLDLQADGGTHVANTREVGGIKVVGTRSKGRMQQAAGDRPHRHGEASGGGSSVADGLGPRWLPRRSRRK